jgi:hypothetical protein
MSEEGSSPTSVKNLQRVWQDACTKLHAGVILCVFLQLA